MKGDTPAGQLGAQRMQKEKSSCHFAEAICCTWVRPEHGKPLAVHLSCHAACTQLCKPFRSGAALQCGNMLAFLHLFICPALDVVVGPQELSERDRLFLAGHFGWRDQGSRSKPGLHPERLRGRNMAASTFRFTSTRAAEDLRRSSLSRGRSGQMRQQTCAAAVSQYVGNML